MAVNTLTTAKGARCWYHALALKELAFVQRPVVAAAVSERPRIWQAWQALRCIADSAQLTSSHLSPTDPDLTAQQAYIHI